MSFPIRSDSLRPLLSRVHADPYGNLFSENTGPRLHKALSPRYVWSKLAVILYEKRHPRHPWINRRAIDLLGGHLRPVHRGFEWGSGVGTCWLARRSRSLVSVEHHAGWYVRVKRQLEAERLPNVDYRLVAELDYVEAMSEFPDCYFDYVLVDGLFRDHALLRSIPRLKPGGWLVFDNANWFLPSDSRTPHSRRPRDGPASELFSQAARRLTGWGTVWTTDGVNDTAVFVKPARAAAAVPAYGDAER
ncbi:MAG: hypothetical protein DMF81_20200 [Acidobacteria bacterium]|nr:MAG: hypothetical protein DMF81_20200 [Acidobacteriota bacterium]